MPRVRTERGWADFAKREEEHREHEEHHDVAHIGPNEATALAVQTCKAKDGIDEGSENHGKRHRPIANEVGQSVHL